MTLQRDTFASMNTTSTATTVGPPSRTEPHNPVPMRRLIDVDIHQTNPSPEQWGQYLPEPYRSEILRYGLRLVISGIRYEEGGYHKEAFHTVNGKSLKDPEFFSEQLLDKYGHRFGVLSGNSGATSAIPDPDYVAAVATAINNFHLEYWLPKDERFLLTLQVPMQDPVAAVREIERLAGTPRVAAVSFFATANRIAFGERYYWPIYEACQKHNLPIHIHPSSPATMANASMTPAGQCATYLESHICMPQFYMAQVTSMVINGVFEKFPRLKIMCIEGGVAWLPHLMWRMDAEYKALRQQAPFLKRLPSQYVTEHFRFGSQPIEEPNKPEHLLHIFDMIDAGKVLMYASDFPHFDFDEPTKFPKAMDAHMRQRIMHDTACELFNLPAWETTAAGKAEAAAAAKSASTGVAQ